LETYFQGMSGVSVKLVEMNFPATQVTRKSKYILL